MSYNLYSATDIEIGGEIYFDDIYSGKYLTQSNYDEYWEVYGKEDNRVYVRFRDNHWIVNVKDIRAHIPPARQEKPQQL